MYVRVASWEGVSAEDIGKMADEINSREGPPEGVPAKRLLVLADEDAGRVKMIPFFDSEEDRAEADKTLKGMSPPGGLGTPDIENYEVKMDVSAP